ncbi:hypothetical protein CH063_05768, partial [Colletotrichum higginsianum]
ILPAVFAFSVLPYALRASRFLAYGPTDRLQRWLRWQPIRKPILTTRCGRYLSLNNRPEPLVNSIQYNSPKQGIDRQAHLSETRRCRVRR